MRWRYVIQSLTVRGVMMNWIVMTISRDVQQVTSSVACPRFVFRSPKFVMALMTVQIRPTKASCAPIKIQVWWLFVFIPDNPHNHIITGSRLNGFTLFTAANLHSCNSGQFSCDEGDCHPLFQRCNNETNCIDGSDENADLCRTLQPYYQVKFTSNIPS